MGQGWELPILPYDLSSLLFRLQNRSFIEFISVSPGMLTQSVQHQSKEEDGTVEGMKVKA